MKAIDCEKKCLFYADCSAWHQDIPMGCEYYTEKEVVLKHFLNLAKKYELFCDEG